MRRRRTWMALLASALLVAPPIVWGCEKVDRPDCSMSDCPMGARPSEEGCDESAAPLSDRGSADCEGGPGAWLSCCPRPSFTKHARLEVESTRGLGAAPPMVLVGDVEMPPPATSPDGSSRSVSSQQHELGRFALLSAFLL